MRYGTGIGCAGLKGAIEVVIKFIGFNDLDDLNLFINQAVICALNAPFVQQPCEKADRAISDAICAESRRQEAQPNGCSNFAPKKHATVW
jgi:hypothetical protein